MATVLYFICEVILALEGFNCNIAVLYTIKRHPALLTSSNMFIAHLAMADILVSLIVVPVAITLELQLTMHYELCSAMNIVLFIFSVSPITMLLTVTLDRFFAIRFPFKYISFLDTSRAHYVACMVWFFNLCILSVPCYLWRKERQTYKNKCSSDAIFTHSFELYYNLICFFIVPITVMLGVYAYIWRVVKKHRKFTVYHFSRFNQSLNKNIQTSNTVFYVFIVFVCTSLPLAVLDMFYIFEVGVSWDIVKIATVLFERLTVILNPLIYTNNSARIKENLFRVHCLKPPATLLLCPTETGTRNATSFMSKDHQWRSSRNVISSAVTLNESFNIDTVNKIVNRNDSLNLSHISASPQTKSDQEKGTSFGSSPTLISSLPKIPKINT